GYRSGYRNEIVARAQFVIDGEEQPAAQRGRIDEGGGGEELAGLALDAQAGRARRHAAGAAVARAVVEDLDLGGLHGAEEEGGEQLRQPVASGELDGGGIGALVGAHQVGVDQAAAKGTEPARAADVLHDEADAAVVDSIIAHFAQRARPADELGAGGDAPGPRFGVAGARAKRGQQEELESWKVGELEQGLRPRTSGRVLRFSTFQLSNSQTFEL